MGNWVCLREGLTGGGEVGSAPYRSDAPPMAKRIGSALRRSYLRRSCLELPVVATPCWVASGQRT